MVVNADCLPLQAASTEASPSFTTSSQSAAAIDAPPLSDTPTNSSYDDANFKYKYPQARPAPPGVDPVTWNKIYNAADSRIYNKANKSAVASKAKRETGETRQLALQVLEEKTATSTMTNTSASPDSLAPSLPAIPMMPKASAAKKPQPSKETQPGSSREATPAAMDMAERIKTEGRPRKVISGTLSEYDSPAPSPIPKIGNPTTQPKGHKPGPKKGTAAPTKKQQDKKFLSKSKVNGMSRLYSTNKRTSAHCFASCSHIIQMEPHLALDRRATHRVLKVVFPLVMIVMMAESIVSVVAQMTIA